MRLLAILLLLSLSFHLVATPGDTEELTLTELKRFIKNSQRTENFETAIYYCQELLKRSNTIKNNLLIASLYEKNMDFEKAAEHYGYVCERENGTSVEACFQQALMYKSIQKYGLAKDILTEISKNRSATDYKQFSRKVKEEITNCASLMEGLPAKRKVAIKEVTIGEIESLGVYSPVILEGNKLLFTAKADNQKFCRLYELHEESSDLKVKLSDFISGNVTEKSHLANCTFSPDGKRFYFTLTTELINNLVEYRIFKMEYENKFWMTPEEIESISYKKCINTYPSVGTNVVTGKDVLYFCSDRPGGLGGMDIWYSEYNPRTKTFSQPRNLGSKINTPKDEITPYYDNDNEILYYSSNGKTGYGGLDVYSAMGEKRRWTEITNMGDPVNSGTDDFYFTKRNKNAYLVSNRKVLTNKNNERIDNLYALEITNVYRLKGKVDLVSSYDKLIQQLSAKYGLQFILNNSDQTKVSISVIESDNLEILQSVRDLETDDNGCFQIDMDEGTSCQVIMSKQGYYEQKLDIADIKEDRETGPIALEKIPDETFSFKIANAYKPDGTYTSELKAFLDDYPQIRIDDSSPEGLDSENRLAAFYIDDIGMLFAEIIGED